LSIERLFFEVFISNAPHKEVTHRAGDKVDDFEIVFGPFVASEHHVDWRIEPNVSSGVVARTLYRLKAVIVSLAVNHLPCLVYVGHGVNSMPLLNKEEVRKLEN